MGNKVRVRARQTRGGGANEAENALKDILVDQYDDTKANYDKLNEEEKAEFADIIGEDLLDAFLTSKMQTELSLNILDDVEDRFERLNAIFDLKPEEDEAGEGN